MDAVVKPTEKCDLLIQIDPKTKIAFTVVDKERIEFVLKEKFENKPHLPTK